MSGHDFARARPGADALSLGPFERRTPHVADGIEASEKSMEIDIEMALKRCLESKK